MSEYTPSTHTVRLAYQAAPDAYGHVDLSARGLRAAEFDRWLATHDLEVARKALHIEESEMEDDDVSDAGFVIGDGYWSVDAMNDFLAAIARHRYGEEQQ